MPKAEHTIMIDRPVDQVFAFFTDPANDPKWRATVKEMAAQGPVRVGSTIHQVVKGRGSGIPADIEVTAYEPSSHYAFKVTRGPVRPVGVFSFSPTGSGTEVSLSLQAELGGVKRLLLGRSVQNSMNGEVASLVKAKAVLEAG
jgi:uncharacterized protein YndB with AHSA1/START domain